MGALADLAAIVRSTFGELLELRVEALAFAGGQTARLAAIALAAALLLALVAGPLWRSTRRRAIALPALLRRFEFGPGAVVRHLAAAIALLGLPFFLLALADPRDAFTRQETSYPGRRIALLLDASSSMLQSLPASRLARGAPNDAAFFTTIGAARYFVELRMEGRYRDLLALIEFGDEAYVVTPFTGDYENILLSISLVGDWTEFMNFPEQGTVIARAIDQGVGLFQAFDFLDAAGNALIIFSDGMDAEVLQDGRSTFDVLREARRAEIPVYFIRAGRPGAGQGGIPDAVWRAAVAGTGGRFYNTADEATLVRAMRDIDRQATGRIEVRNYRTQVPRFAPFALAAASLWTLALGLRLGTPWFTKFP